jgi:plastocyanin domain-containing protein
MTAAQIAVTIGGVAAIAWVLWFFLFARGTAVAAASVQGVQEVHVLVKGGYTPDTIIVQAGTPVRLQFYRDETAECSDTVVFDALGIRQQLPAFATTTVEFTPRQAGEYPFHCGLSMLQGMLVVEPPGERRGASSPHKFHG